MREPRWNANGLLPAIVQDARSGAVLTLAYMNAESLGRTLAEGRTVFWSRSRQELWPKGETSGHVQRVREVRLDCDGDALLVQVEPEGPACHTGQPTCFFEVLEDQPGLIARRKGADGVQPRRPEIGAVLQELAAAVAERGRNPEPDSYVARQFARGIDGPLKKVAEEAGEVLLAAKAGDRAATVFEVADLWFHTLLVLEMMGIGLKEVAAELASRRGQRRGGASRP